MGRRPPHRLSVTVESFILAPVGEGQKPRVPSKPPLESGGPRRKFGRLKSKTVGALLLDVDEDASEGPLRSASFRGGIEEGGPVGDGAGDRDSHMLQQPAPHTPGDPKPAGGPAAETSRVEGMLEQYAQRKVLMTESSYLSETGHSWLAELDAFSGLPGRASLGAAGGESDADEEWEGTTEMYTKRFLRLPDLGRSAVKSIAQRGVASAVGGSRGSARGGGGYEALRPALDRDMFGASLKEEDSLLQVGGAVLASPPGTPPVRDLISSQGRRRGEPSNRGGAAAMGRKPSSPGRRERGSGGSGGGGPASVHELNLLDLSDVPLTRVESPVPGIPRRLPALHLDALLRGPRALSPEASEDSEDEGGEHTFSWPVADPGMSLEFREPVPRSIHSSRSHRRQRGEIEERLGGWMDRVLDPQTEKRALRSSQAERRDRGGDRHLLRTPGAATRRSSLSQYEALVSNRGQREREADILATQRRVEGSLLSLNHSVTANRQMDAITSCIAANTRLRSIELSSCGIDDEGVALLVDGLISSASQVAYLYLDDNRIGAAGAEKLTELLTVPKGGKGGAVTPKRAMLMRQETMVQRASSPHRPRMEYFMPVMEELVLRGNSAIGDRGVKALALGLLLNSSLRKLDLGRCGVGDAGAAALGDTLEENTYLSELALGWNRIGVRGARGLCHGLSYNIALVRVDVSWNGLGDVGGSHLAEALTKNSKLVEVDLSGNQIRESSCMMLAKCLATNSTLQVLHLADNALGTGGAIKLMEAAKNGQLRRLNLQRCSFGGIIDRSAAKTLFDKQDPNGRYLLDLALPAQYAVAEELAELWKEQPGSWKSAKLRGGMFRLTAEMNWPARMPPEGMLDVDFVAEHCLPVDAKPLTEDQFARLWVGVNHPEASDGWRLGLVKVLIASNYFTAAQGGAMVGGFEWGQEKVQAAVVLFGRLCDPENIEKLLVSMSPAQVDAVQQQLGMLARFHPNNPTGHYELNLANQVDTAILGRLKDCWSAEARKGLLKPPLKHCWRNVSIDGVHMSIVPDTPEKLTLPKKGMLRLDYVSHHEPSASTKRQVYSPSWRMRFLALYGQMQSETLKSASVYQVVRDIKEKYSDTQLKFVSRLLELGQARSEREAYDRLGRADRAQAIGRDPGGSGGQSMAGRVQRLVFRENIAPAASVISATRYIKRKSTGFDTDDCVSDPHKALELLRAYLTEHHVTIFQAMQIVRLFSYKTPDVRADVAVSLFSRVVQRSAFAAVLQVLTPEEQAAVNHRLGARNTINWARPDLHYRLELRLPDDNVVGRRLVGMAQSMSGEQFYGLRINNGPEINIPENQAMWRVLCGNPRDGEVPQTTVEFTFRSFGSATKIEPELETAASIVQSMWKAREARASFKRQQAAFRIILRFASRHLARRRMKQGHGHGHGQGQEQPPQE